MAEPSLNFSTDIAPIRNTFGLTSRESSYTNRVADEAMAPQLDMMLKLRNQLTKERNSDLAYQSSLFDLQQRKKAAEDRIEFAQKSEQLTEPLLQIMDQEDADPFDQMQALQRFGIQNNKVLQRSPEAKQLFDSATKGLQAKLNQDNQEYAKKRTEIEDTRYDRKEQDSTSLLLRQAAGVKTAEDLQKLKDNLNSSDGADPNFYRKADALEGLGDQAFEATKVARAKETRDQNAQAASLSQKRAGDLFDLDKSYLDNIDAQITAADKAMAAIEGQDDDSLDKKQALVDQFRGMEFPDGTKIESADNLGAVRKQLNQQRKKLSDQYKATLKGGSSSTKVGKGFGR